MKNKVNFLLRSIRIGNGQNIERIRKVNNMETWYCEVVSIDGDYANLKRTDIESDDLKLVARALLPAEIYEGCRWKNETYRQ